MKVRVITKKGEDKVRLSYNGALSGKMEKSTSWNIMKKIYNA